VSGQQAGRDPQARRYDHVHEEYEVVRNGVRYRRCRVCSAQTWDRGGSPGPLPLWDLGGEKASP
jgi:hypothetical protein